MIVVVNVLHFCFELRALKITSRMKHLIVFNQWDLTHLSHIEYASLFKQYNFNIMTYRLSAQNAPKAHERVCVALNELLLRTYSALFFVLLVLCAEEIITIVLQWSSLLQRNSTKCILYEINNIYTIYLNRLKCFEITCTLPDQKNPVFHSACVNLSLVKDLNLCAKMLFCRSRIKESET